MSTPAGPASPGLSAGAVVYAKDLARVAAFYASVAGLAVAATEPDFVVLSGGRLELAVVRIPDSIADSIEVETPPIRRADTAVKLVFPVASLAAARAAAVGLGGVVDPVEREWTFRGATRCDGHDPEGNVFQLGEPC